MKRYRLGQPACFRAAPKSEMAGARTVRPRLVRRFGVMVISLLTLAALTSVQAQTIGDIYKGKQIRIIVGDPAPNDYDLWARLIGRHIVRYIPGSPSVIVENMPGAGGLIAANYLYNVAPRDGL